jgi:hypothetical protein
MLGMTSGAGIEKCDLLRAQSAMNISKQQQTWRSRLTRDVGLSVFIKLGSLTLLWALFF